MINRQKEQIVLQLFGKYTKNITFSWLINQNLRRKIILQIDSNNILGEFLPKTHQHNKIISHPLAEEIINIFLPRLQNFLYCFAKNFISQIQIIAFDNILDVVFTSKKSLSYQQKQALTNFAYQNSINLSLCFLQQNEPILIIKPCLISINNLNLQVTNEVFLQASKSGLNLICAELINFILNLKIKHKPTIAELYCGFGIYSFALHHLISNSKAFDGNKTMIDLANKNIQQHQLSNKITAYTRDLFFNPLNYHELNKFEAIIINPPRNGASTQIMQIAKSKLKNICYVSCNPYSLLNDLKILLDYNYCINTIHAINQFADGKHIELVVNFTRFHL
jgi:23S rRNA (uracil1939-C5)-methyltransferase